MKRGGKGSGEERRGEQKGQRMVWSGEKMEKRNFCAYHNTLMNIAHL